MFRRVERSELLSPPSWSPAPWLELVPAPAPGTAAVSSFPAYIVVAADVDRDWLTGQFPDMDYAAPSGPQFLYALENRLGLHAGALDVTLLAPPLPGEPALALNPVTASDHPRVERAHRYRDEMRVWTTEHGVLIVGRGLAGRWETAVEVDERSRGTGHGRALATAARHLVPDGRPVWAQVAPGNAASLRAFLAAGYVPVGSEVILTPWRHS